MSSSETGDELPRLIGEFFELAKATAAASGSEEYLRSAISRAYFANYLLAEDRLTRSGRFESSGGADDHGGVVRALKQGKLRSLGDLLAGLRERRNHADYHISTPNLDCERCKSGTVVTADDWTDCLAEAEKCFTRLRTV